MRPGGRPARPGQEEQAHTNTCGTRAWRPPTRKVRFRRPHETAPVHRPSPPSNDGRSGKPDASVTGSTHANHRSARSPRPMPEGPARDNPIAGPRTGTTRSEPSASSRRGPAAGTKSPVLGRPPRAPRSRPVKPGAQAPGVGKGTTATGKPTGAPSHRTGRGAAHHTGPRGTPERHAAGHNQATRTGAKQRRPPGATNPESAHNTQRTTAHEQVPGNSQPKHHKPQPRVAGRSQSPGPSTHTHNAHPNQEWRGAAETRAQTHTPTPRTRPRSGCVQAERAHEHTHSPTPQPGVAGCSRNPSPNTHTHTAHPCQDWLGASGARTRAHTQPNIQARSGGAQPQPEPRHTHPHRAPVPGVAGCKRSAHTSTHTAQHPSQEWRGGAATRAQTHTSTPRTRATSGWVQAGHAHQHTHTPTPQPGVAGRSRNPSPNTHTHTTHPSQEWRGASGAPTPAHTQPNTPARSGGAQPKPEPKHTHPHRAPVPGVAGCKRSAHTSTHKAQHPSHEWLGAAATGAQTHTPTPRTRARSGLVQAERVHEHTHSPTPQPRVAGRSRNPSPNTHTHTAHPWQEWMGASGARTPAHRHPNTPARSGGAQPKPEPKHTHPHRAPQPGVAGCKQSAHTSTHTCQHPSQEWRGAAQT